MSVNVEYTDTMIYVIFPQDLKYEDEKALQKMVDSFYKLEKAIYRKWAKKNGYKYKKMTDEPWIYVEVEDGTTIAELDKLSETIKMK